MKTIPLVLLFSSGLLVAAATGRANVERSVDRTFTVTGAGTIHLTTSGGSIKVLPGGAGVIKITAHERIKADSDAEADALLKDLELTFDQAGSAVTATAKYRKTMGGFHWGSWPPVQVDFEATVPASYSADLHSSGGGITVGDLAGAVAARTSGGGIKLGKIGGKVDARTSGGSISLSEAHAEAKLDTSGGNISVGRVAGPAELSTSGGSISIDAVEQRLTAHTNGGSIHAGLSGPLKDDCELSTSGGGIHVTVDPSAAFHLNASTSGGIVRADGLTITLRDEGRGRTHLQGDVNGGGPELKLHTSGGNVDIKAR